MRKGAIRLLSGIQMFACLNVTASTMALKFLLKIGSLHILIQRKARITKHILMQGYPVIRYRHYTRNFGLYRKLQGDQILRLHVNYTCWANDIGKKLLVKISDIEEWNKGFVESENCYIDGFKTDRDAESMKHDMRLKSLISFGIYATVF